MSGHGTVQSVSIIMPTYNEAGNVSGLIAESAAYVRQSGVARIEVIVVDDDSPDSTWKVAAETMCPDAEVRVIRRMKDHGLTASIREGIAAAAMDVIVWFDCDYSQPPDRIPQLLFMLNQGFDVVVNSRYVLGGGENRTGKGGSQQLFLSKWLNRLLRVLLNSGFYDYTSGFVAVRRAVFDDVALRGDYGEYFIDFVYRVLESRRYRVCELPYIMQPRRYGESKTGTNLLQYLRRGGKYLLTVLRLKFG